MLSISTDEKWPEAVNALIFHDRLLNANKAGLALFVCHPYYECIHSGYFSPFFFLFCFDKHLYFTVFSSKSKACIILFSLHIPVISDHGSQFMNCASCSILLLTYANRIKQVGRDLRRSLFPTQSRGSSEVRLSWSGLYPVELWTSKDRDGTTSPVNLLVQLFPT